MKILTALSLFALSIPPALGKFIREPGMTPLICSLNHTKKATKSSNRSLIMEEGILIEVEDSKIMLVDSDLQRLQNSKDSKFFVNNKLVEISKNNKTAPHRLDGFITVSENGESIKIEIAIDKEKIKSYSMKCIPQSLDEPVEKDDVY